MLVLFETPAGFALFKVVKPGVLKTPDEMYKEFQTPEAAQSVIKLKKFQKFVDIADAVAAAKASGENELHKGLRKFLKKTIVDKALTDKLTVADPKQGNLISEQFGLKCLFNPELMRCIRSQLDALLVGEASSEMKQMRLGLAHSLSRYKLKFSPDKVDTMIVQAISLLDELDKELNTYAMRVREWYGWHFPELSKIVPENILYAKLVKLMGNRVNAATSPLSDLLPEHMEGLVREAAQISMGTEMSQEDIDNVLALCDQVIEINTYREELYEYIKARMQAIAPNLTILVGEIVGARLISKAGSLVNLAKYPSSTVQILGAEKALFRALKTRHETPKYGLIYHASLVGQAAPKHKGKISRVLAAKASLSIRLDALGEGVDATPSLGMEGRVKVENRIRQLEGKPKVKSSLSVQQQKYDYTKVASAPHLDRKPSQYNPAADIVMEKAQKKKTTKQKPIADVPMEDEAKEKKDEPEKKKKKKAETEEAAPLDTEKKKKRKREDTAEDSGAASTETPKLKKKKKKTSTESE